MYPVLRAASGRVVSRISSSASKRLAGTQAPTHPTSYGYGALYGPSSMVQSAGTFTQAAKTSRSAGKSFLSSSRRSLAHSGRIHSGSWKNAMSTSSSQRARFMSVNLGPKEDIYKSGYSRRYRTSLNHPEEHAYTHL